MKTGEVAYGTVVTIDAHDGGPRHPERPGRLEAVEKGIEFADLTDALIPLPGRVATRPELERVHSAAFVDQMEALHAQGGGVIDQDTVTSPGSWPTALASAGLGLAAIDALQAGQAASAFVAPRPPGHHATPDHAMGFCLINNVAVAAAALAEEGNRVVILDWDVHHGNGTQDIFWDDPRVLYASIHQSPAYPGTGSMRETGGPTADGLTINVPLRPGATGDAARHALDEIITPSVEAFDPDWILISAGFDAHRDDPLADLLWTAADYAALTSRLLALAPSAGRTIAFLEGGYDLRALAFSSAATIATLAGVTPPPEE